jgi:hypothetical protein
MQRKSSAQCQHKKLIMKNSIRVFVLVFLFICFMASCKKNNSSSGTRPILTLSSSTVKRNEPLVASTNVVSTNLVVRWSVNTNASNGWISSAGNKSIILFSNAGNYTVTASYFTDSSSSTPYDSSSSPVVVTDSIYNDSTGQWASCGTLVQVGLSSTDQISLTPISYSDTGLVFIAHTQENYDNHYPHLDYYPVPDTIAQFGAGFATVTESPCGNSTATATPATSIISFSGLTNGTSSLVFYLNGTKYEGTITVSNTQCAFIWNYSSGITISPLLVQKQ